MKQTIQILNDNVINQIAAGEVIQRPSSIIKELLENSIDAQANNIHIIIKKSGKGLIQIIDNGIGMNIQDAKVCFIKHATSKIESTEDITKISSMGFRGEALASIASVAEVELKTKTQDEEIGTLISIDNSKINKITQTACKRGTSIIVKNLFFNIPARKNFLKSDKIELKHIIETFIQIALSHHHINFQFTNDGKQLYNLSTENFKNRIIQLFGRRYKQKILQIKEQTTIVSIDGFLGNPLDAKKTRGEQYLFVNNRFIRSPYLNHAIKESMADLIQTDQHPSYFIFLNIDPEYIDVNVHPNKTEVKFEDEKSIYQILKSACKRTIGMSNIKPSLDFSIEKSFEVPIHILNNPPKEPKININSKFNPFSEKFARDKENTQNIQQLFKEENTIDIYEVFNIDNRYALFKINHDNIINLIDKKKAIERIIYDQTIQSLNNQEINSQLTTNPTTVELNTIDMQIIKENNTTIEKLGYKIQSIEKENIIISAIPFYVNQDETQEFIELIIESIKKSNTITDKQITKEIAKKIAYQKTTHEKYPNNKDLLIKLINNLMKCEIPFIGIDGKPSVISVEPNKIFN